MEGVLKAPQQGVGEREAVQQPQRRGRAVFLIEREVSCWRPILGGGGASRLHCGPLPFLGY